MDYKKGKYKGAWIYYYNKDGSEFCKIKATKNILGTVTTKIEYL